MDRVSIILLMMTMMISLRSSLCLSNPAIVKTLRFKEGDIVDCFIVNKQPTLDHPLLINHTVQMRPAFPSKSATKSLSKNLARIAEREICPEGSVPIPRPTKQSHSVSNKLFTTDIAYIGRGFSGHHRVFVNMKRPPYPSFQGGGAYIGIFNEPVSPTQTSGAFVLLHNGSPAEMNLISAGWITSKRIFVDTIPRLYIYWTANGYKTSCYNNNNCQGFVQIDRHIYPSIPMYPASTPGSIYSYHCSLRKDTKRGNWWLVASFKDKDNVHVGYWPKEMMPYLADGARMVAWGGMVVAGEDGRSPPMGSGHFPRGNYSDDSSFLRLTYIDDKFNEQSPRKDQTDYYGGKSGCYGLKNDGPVMPEGYSFIYGGPGGNCGI